MKERGFSLIEVLVVTAMMGVALLAFSTAYSQIQKSQRIISQKLEMNDLKTIIQKLVMDANYCSWQVQGPTAARYTIDTSTITENVKSNVEVNLPALYFGVDTAAHNLAAPGQLLTGTTTGLRVLSVKINNFYSTQTPDRYLADIEVIFNPNSMPMSLNPVRTPVFLSLEPGDPATAKRISACSGTPATPVPVSGAMFIARQQMAYDQNGGAITPNTWFTRPLNTEVVVPNPIVGASLSGNQIVLPAGTYEVFAQAHADSVDDNIARFYNVTDGVEVVLGTMSFSADGSGQASNSVIVGAFTINATKHFSLQHYFTRQPSDVPSAAMGGAAGFPGVPNIYAVVQIRAL